MRYVELKPTVLDPTEVSSLVRFAPIALVLGTAIGFFASTYLWGEDLIEQSFWTEALKIAGLAAIPLVALAARLTRVQQADYQHDALIFEILGLATALGVILLCLHQAAVVPKAGLDAEDWQVTVVMTGVGLTFGALAVGVAAEVLDKIDTPAPEPEPAPQPPPAP